jgi:hypothetical protein
MVSESRTRWRTQLAPVRLFVAAMLAWAVVVGLGLALGAPLTGDESAYALLARGTHTAWLYRPRGVVLLAQLGTAIGGGDVALRLASTLVSFGFIGAAGALGGRLSAWTGAWAACVIAGSHAFVLRAPELLGDMPAAACLLAATTLLVGELARDGGPRWRIAWAAPALAAAFYLRYGSAPVIAMIVCGALACWWRAVWARPWPVIATVAALGVAIVPFAIVSIERTGSLTGILELSKAVASHDEPGHGLRMFVASNLFNRYGALVAPVAAIGLVAIVWPPPAPRTARYLAVMALGQIVSIGIVGHGSARYVFFALAVLVVLGVDVIRRFIVARAWRRIGIGIAATSTAAAWLALACVQPRIQAHIAGELADMVAAGHAIRDDAAGQPCVVAARAVPQLMWYSGCDAVKLDDATLAHVPLPADRTWYAASAPRRPIDGPAFARTVGGHAVALPASGAWRIDR